MPPRFSLIAFHVSGRHFRGAVPYSPPFLEIEPGDRRIADDHDVSSLFRAAFPEKLKEPVITVRSSMMMTL